MKDLNTENKERGIGFLFRLSFVIPQEEIQDARYSLSSASSPSVSKELETSQSENHPMHWEKFIARPEALSYLQDKVDNGFQYLPGSKGITSICQSNGNLPRLDKVLWSSIYRIRYAAADTFHKSFLGTVSHGTGAGHILLVGDAAHIHSPFGGQGMNLGILDGLRCGQAIVEHWRSLHTYLLLLFLQPARH